MTRMSSLSDMATCVCCVFVCLLSVVSSDTIPLPPFADLKKHYPGFWHHGGQFRNHDIIRELRIQDQSNLLQHDTSALRMSYTLNRIGGPHSLGSNVIRLSKYGTDSVQGRYGLQYMFHPLAYGPFLADKYGYPTVSKLHLFDPVKTKQSFTGKQGIMRVITYTQRNNEPAGHVGLWDCSDFYQARDYFFGHTLLSVEFWESPDTDCSHVEKDEPIKLTADEKDPHAMEIDSHILSLLKINHKQRHRPHNKTNQ